MEGPNKTADQQIRQQVEAVHITWREAINKGDGQSAAGVFTPNGIAVDAYGKLGGVSQALSERVQAVHKRGLNLTTTIDEVVQPLSGGQVVLASGTFTATYTDINLPSGRGNWIQVYEREGEGWKIRASAIARVVLTTPTN
jgi:ketosteroid isomerase-like protein